MTDRDLSGRTLFPVQSTLFDASKLAGVTCSPTPGHLLMNYDLATYLFTH